MTYEERERIRRRRRMKKNIRRTMRTILLLPSHMPRIPGQVFATAVKACELIGLAFVVILICSMLNPSGLMTFLRTVSALAFFTLFFFIKIDEYQDILENYSLS